MSVKYLVSACLAGIECRYDGRANTVDTIEAIVSCDEAIVCCPEVMGGMKTPRTPCEIKGADGHDVLSGKAVVVDANGVDRSKEFIQGAHKALELCKAFGIATAILKAKSPSCGCENIYDGSFSGTLKKGCGVTAALLIQNGIKVYSEDDCHER